jgi:ubiquinone/menaquinone biosynthesis C-methylase UbiE
MPTFEEIYTNHATEYDELVNHEDWQGNLPAFLDKAFDFTGKTVIEPGVGTGRLTRLYIDKAARAYCYDRSPHMLLQAARNLSRWKDKLSFEPCDNRELHTLDIKGDFVVEGWSFGHSVDPDPERLEASVRYLVESSARLLNPGGKIIILETLGTQTGKPFAPAPFLESFYNLLERAHGFTKEVIATDYRFDSLDEAARITGFFFGDAMRLRILEKGSPVVGEYTGVWYR